MFKNAERKNNFEVEKVGRENDVKRNHTKSVLNWKKIPLDVRLSGSN